MTRVGIGPHISIGEETTYGTAVAGSKDFSLKPGDENLTERHDPIEYDGMHERGIDKADVEAGPYTVEGTWGTDIRFGGGWGVLYEHLCANRFSPSGAGPYVHTLDVGSYAAALIGKGLTAVIDKDGLLGSSDDAWEFYGLRPVAIEMSLEYGGKCRIETTFIGKGAAFTTQPSPTFVSDSFVVSPSADATAVAGFNYGTTDYVCRNWKVRVEVPHDEVRDMQSRRMEEPYAAGHILVTGSAEVRFPGTGTTGDAFTADYRAKTHRDIIITAQGPTKEDEEVKWTLNDVLLTADPEPHPDVAGVYWQSLEFKAYRDGAGFEAELSVTNSDSAIFS